MKKINNCPKMLHIDICCYRMLEVDQQSGQHFLNYGIYNAEGNVVNKGETDRMAFK
jgi:hypothetical protein